MSLQSFVECCHTPAYKLSEPPECYVLDVELLQCHRLSQFDCCVQTVRLWNRHSGACTAVLLLPSIPTAVTLMSDDLVAVTHNCTCSVFKGPKSLRHIVSSDQQHICATAILDNQLFIASVGEGPSCLLSGLKGSSICTAPHVAPHVSMANIFCHTYKTSARQVPACSM